MDILISDTVEILAKEAAKHAASILNNTIREKGTARFIAATGASQFEFLKSLIEDQKVDWSRTEMFHLDEYVGISSDHPASFRRYLLDRLIEPAGISTKRLIEGDAKDMPAEIESLNSLIGSVEIDVAFVGIGENGHLAFNDPPADFDTEVPYIVVELDRKCRQQQVNEGWFATVDDVPSQAVSMTVRQIMKSREIVCVVPGARKETAVTECLGEEVISNPMKPASILKNHPAVRVFLDRDSGAGLAE